MYQSYTVFFNALSERWEDGTSCAGHLWKPGGIHALQLLWQSQGQYTATKIPFIYSQKRDSAASVPVSTFMYLWMIYIFLGSFHIFSCSRIGRPIAGIYKSLTHLHECGNWDWGRAIAFLKIFVSNFWVLCLCSIDWNPRESERTQGYFVAASNIWWQQGFI